MTQTGLDIKSKLFPIAAGLLFVLVCAMTYPLILRFTTHIPGFGHTDESYSVLWHSWFIKFSLLNHLSIQKTPLIGYPFGVELYTGNQPFGHIFFAINWILSIITTPVLTYNLQVLVNLFLTAYITFLLVYFVTKNELCGFFSGVVFGFCPYMFVRSWQHLGETYLWIMPMILLGLFVLRDNPSVKIMTFCVLGLILAAINFNVVYYVIVIMALYWIYSAIFDRAHLKDILIVAISAFLISLPQFYPIFKNTLLAKGSAPAAFNLYHRPFADLLTQSAKPLSYFLPAISHPVFGKFTEQFIGSPLYGVSYTEHTLYLGWTTLILAFIAFKQWRKRRKLSAIRYPLYANEDFYIGFFVWLAIVAWLFSQPPYFTFPHFKIYMPSFFMYKILPMFRAYCRFGIVVMLAISALAGFGLKFIISNIKNQKPKMAITFIFCGLVLFEFLNFPPVKVIDLTKYPKVYDWLRGEKGDFAIAEYPLDTKSPNEYYKFCQTIHEKKMINGTIPGTYANKVAKGIWRLSEPRTVGQLSWMKVRYALVHRGSYERSGDIELLDELEKLKTRNLSGLKFIKGLDDVDVYEIIATPRELDIRNE